MFTCYIDRLIKILRQSNIGCRIGNEYLGVFVFADDIFLLSASRPGLQAMVSKCEDFASKNNLKFSTNVDPEKSKTKGIIFSSKTAERTDVAPIVLCGDNLPWRDNLKLLGNIVQNDNSMKSDNDVKRGRFIGKIHSLTQEFGFTSPEVQMKMIKTYATSFYGSNLYRFYTDQCDKLYSAYNICVRNIFKVPLRTHRYLIESISSCLHPKVMICSRFVKFVDSLLECNKPAIIMLGNLVKNDNSKVCGKNLSLIASLCDTTQANLIPHLVKKVMKYQPIPEKESWRQDILNELLLQRRYEINIEDFERRELDSLIDLICIS